jgi:hypothetical protein
MQILAETVPAFFLSFHPSLVGKGARGLGLTLTFPILIQF